MLAFYLVVSFFSYLCSMKKDEIITFLQQLVESQKLQLESQNRQIDDLIGQVASLTDEMASLRALHVQKGRRRKRLNGVNFFEYISDVINKAAALPPNTLLKKYRMLLPDKWKENR